MLPALRGLDISHVTVLREEQPLKQYSPKLVTEEGIVMDAREEHFANQMSDGSERMVEYHPWSRPTHDRPDSFLHFRSVAVDWAFLAGGLLLAIAAAVESAVGIIQQIPTTCA